MNGWCKPCCAKNDKQRAATPESRFGDYASNAKKRKIAFKISFELFKTYWREICFYCGYEIQTVGLDRIDNNKGYVPENIISCCRWCNQAKSNRTKDEFIALCTAVYLRHGQYKVA